MKKKIIVILMAMTIAFSAVACTSANTADATSQEASVEATTVETTESADAASSIDSLEADLEEKSENSINEYFFSNISDEHIYDVTEFLYEDIDSVSVDVSMVSSFTNGNVYSITIDYEDCPGRYYWGISDRFDLGLFYVTDEEIYMVYPSADDISSEEEFLSKGVLVCSANDSDETVDGEHRRIVNEGDSCTFYSSNTLTESGFYYSYTWTKGKGLSFYRSGYGAEGDPIEITLNIPGDSSNNVSDYDSAEMMEGEALTQDELKSFQDYFNQADNYIFTIPNYRTPDMINVDGVTADADRPEIVCLEGVKKDNMIQVVVSYSESTRYKRRVTLVETGDSDQPYQFYSCRQLWEEAMDKIIEAPVYGTDETVTCGVITKYDAWTTEIDIIEDNAVSSIVSLSPYVGAENVASDEVKEIAFCDIDNDGENNLIAICVYGNETRAILCGGHRDQNGIMKYTEWKEGYSIWLEEKVSDLTADNVINYILEHQDELNNV